jgi:uncharacterized RDD family membrane protein YckC
MDDQTQPGQPIQPWAPPGEPIEPAPTAAAPEPAMDVPPPGAESAPPAAQVPPPAAPVPPVAWAAAPAVAPGISVPGASGIFFASIWARFAAFIVDGLIIALIELVLSLIVGAALGSTDGTTITPFGPVPRQNPAVLVITALLDVAVSFLYFTTQWRGAHRATFGMRACSIQIGNAFDGVALTSRQAVLRWAALGYPLGLLSALASTAGIGVLLLVLLDIALFLTTLGSTTRQGWHDQVANSAVIRRPGSSGSNSGAIAIVIIVVVIGGIALISVVTLFFLGAAISGILSTVGSSI